MVRGAKLFLLLLAMCPNVWSVDQCVVYNFEKDFDIMFSSEEGFCFAMKPWNLRSYTTLEIESPHSLSTVFISPNSDFSCVTSYIFQMSNNGVLELNVFMSPGDGMDSISILVNEITLDGNPDTTVDTYAYTPSNPDFIPGWQTIKLNLSRASSYFEGYITLMGSASDGAIVLVDSFRFIPATYDEESCKIYVEDVDDNDNDGDSGNGDGEDNDGNDGDDEDDDDDPSGDGDGNGDNDNDNNGEDNEDEDDSSNGDGDGDDNGNDEDNEDEDDSSNGDGDGDDNGNGEDNEDEDDSSNGDGDGDDNGNGEDDEDDNDDTDGDEGIDGDGDDNDGDDDDSIDGDGDDNDDDNNGDGEEDEDKDEEEDEDGNGDGDDNDNGSEDGDDNDDEEGGDSEDSGNGENEDNDNDSDGGDDNDNVDNGGENSTSSPPQTITPPLSTSDPISVPTTEDTDDNNMETTTSGNLVTTEDPNDKPNSSEFWNVLTITMVVIISLVCLGLICLLFYELGKKKAQKSTPPIIIQEYDYNNLPKTITVPRVTKVYADTIFNPLGRNSPV